MIFFCSLFTLIWIGNLFATDGKINFYVYHLKEADTVSISDTKKISHLFRSRDSETTRLIDSRLLELIDQIEDHFGVRQMEIISGFRSQAFNRELKETGHHVANESLHIKGMAADIHLDEITEEAVRDYALSLHRGGVGFYPSLNMVHVDVGPVRTWGEPVLRKPWVGEKNEHVPVTLTVTPDRTLTKELDRLTMTPTVGAGLPRPGTETVPLQKQIILQFFEKTGWKDVKQFPLEAKIISLKPWKDDLKDLPFGKYRLQVITRGPTHEVQYSNEFYFKKE